MSHKKSIYSFKKKVSKIFPQSYKIPINNNHNATSHRYASLIPYIIHKINFSLKSIKNHLNSY